MSKRTASPASTTRRRRSATTGAKAAMGATPQMELRKSFQFEAAHLLPHLPKAHKCRRLHGHSFKVEIVVRGQIDPQLGWLMDYADISAAFKPLWQQLDHRYLNEIPGLQNPTSEILALWIWQRLQPKLPLLAEVVVAETCQSRCVYRG
jgi:6-pyruvoyltetrahydropterin/6-carboxytetrahydropterin synthase